MAWREIIRFVRQRNRVVGAIGQPILFWLLFGVGMKSSFRMSGMDFSEYFIPGTVVLILLFTAIFATISIIEDRQEGFLQSVLVAPLPRWTFVLGKVTGGSLLAVSQALMFLILTVAAGYHVSIFNGLIAILMMIVVAIGLTCLGFCLAWRLDSTQGFHAIMSLLLMPMWLLSGAFFPIAPMTADASLGQKLLSIVMRCNPVTYAVAGLRGLFSEARNNAMDVWTPSPLLCWVITVVFATVMFYLSVRSTRRTTQGDLQ